MVAPICVYILFGKWLNLINKYLLSLKTRIVHIFIFHLSGLLQFSVGQLPPDSDEVILPATTAPRITVKEEIGHVSLLVIRAQGLLGRVLVQYRTVSLTAFSPQDYQV